MIAPDGIPDALAARLGLRLRELRTEAGRTLASVATQAGMSVSHLSSVEKGLNLPSLPALARISEALDVTIGDLMREEGQNHVRRAKLPRTAATVAASHEQLVLNVMLQRADPHSAGTCPVPVEDHEVSVYIRAGALDIQLDDEEKIELREGDAVDIREPRTLTWSTGAFGATSVWSSALTKSS